MNERVHVFTGAGNDLIDVGSVKHSLDDLHANMNVDGGSGYDRQHVIDTGAIGTARFPELCRFASTKLSASENSDGCAASCAKIRRTRRFKEQAL